MPTDYCEQKRSDTANEFTLRADRNGNAGNSTLGACPRQSFPFTESPAKAKFAGGLPTEAGGGVASFAALGVVHVPIVPVRNDDVHCERVFFGVHFLHYRFHFFDRHSGFCRAS